MNTFEITIQRKAGDSWPVIAEQSRPGSYLPVRTEGVLNVDPERLLGLLDPLAYGTHLGQALFAENVRDAFTRALADSNQDLRVLLFIEADDLRTLRWERLCAPLNNRWSILARNSQVLFSLYLPSATDSRFPAIGRRDLRALIVAASPAGLERYGLSHFDVPHAISCATEALGEIPYDVLASGAGVADHPALKPVGPASLAALAERLMQEKYTLLHIVGHGSYNKRTGETSLFLANNQHELERVTAAQLIEHLGNISNASTLPHFTFLSTCESAAPEAEGALGGLGQRLVRDLGMPAVIAMTEKVSVVTALGLTKAFYRQLRQHGEVDRALVEASASLNGATDITVPALYSRLGGRPLFSDLLTQDRPLTNAEIRYGLEQLSQLLVTRAPVLLAAFEAAATRLRATLSTEAIALSPAMGAERQTALAEIDAINSEVLDFSFKALALGQIAPAYDDRCPYLGLAAFHAENRAFFFGREPLVAQLVNRLAEHNFLAVLGGSGSGKSSLVLAGVVPALQAQNPTLAVRYLTPTSNPLAQLDTALAAAAPDQPQLLVVDQFEELFTLCTDPTHRQQFLDRLLALLVEPKSKIQNPKSKIVLTMRADFWGECATFPKLRELMQAHQELVGPMNAQELRSSMEQQARVVGLRFETDLSNTILDDVSGEPGAMPLLQHALLELWKRRHGRWLRSAEYRALGGVHQAIARTADSIYHALDESDRERMRAIFLRLTRLDDGSQGEEQRDTRRRVQLDELAASATEASAVQRLVQRLADNRLVITSVREVNQRRFSEVEVTHEALIRHWPRLRHWLDEDRVVLHLRQAISNEAAQWEANNCAEDLLPRWNARLEEAQRLAFHPRFGLNQRERAYLAACVALRDRETDEKEAQRQRELQQAQALAAEQRQRAEEQAASAANLRKRAVFLAVAGALAVLLAVAAGWFGVRAQRSEVRAEIASGTAETRRKEAEAAKVEADTERDKAEVQAALARSHELGVYAESARDAGNLDLALLLRIEGARTQPTLEMMNGLRTLLIDKKRTLLRIPGHNKVTEARWNKAQSQLLIAYEDGSAGVWSAQDGKQLLKLAEHDTSINTAAWSPDEKRMLITSDDGVVRIWDAQSGARLVEILADPHHINAAAWDKAGARILTAGDDATARIWDAQTGQEIRTLSGHTDIVRLAYWNAAGDRILTAGDDHTARIWDVQTGKALHVLSGHSGLITSAAWNPDESRVLTADDNAVHIWDAQSGKEVRSLKGHEDSITSAAWSPDGTQILTASKDHTARIWDVATGGELKKLANHTDTVREAIWSEDGALVLTISADKTARVWEPSEGTLLFTLVGHTNKVTSGAWGKDAGKILTASDDGTVRIWSASTSVQPTGELPDLTHHTGRISQMMWNAAGNRLLTAGQDDATVRIVDAQSGEKLVSLEVPDEGINDVRWNRSEKQVLIAGADGSARVWDVTTKQELWQVKQAKQIFTAAWSPDEKMVLTASEDGTARIWDAATHKELRMLRGHGNGVLQASWSRDGSRILTASMDDTARVWDAKTGKQLLKLDGHTGDVTLAFWNHDESRIFTASEDGAAKMWDAQSGALLKTLGSHTAKITAMRLNKAETDLLLASEDGAADMWELATGKEVWQVKHAKAIADAAWSPDEQTMLTVSEDGTAKLWDVHGQEKATLSTYAQPLSHGLWSRDGKRVLTASDTRVRQFYTQATDVMMAACARGAIRNMTHEEWKQFMDDRRYQKTCPGLSEEQD